MEQRESHALPVGKILQGGIDALAHLAEWLTHQGQAVGKPLLYVPLPASIQALAEKTLKKMVGPSGDPFL